MTCGAEQRLEQFQQNMSNMARMVSLMSWALLLGLGLSYTAQGESVGGRVGQVGGVVAPEKLKVGHRIEGELLRIEGKDYFVMAKGGLEIRLHSNPTTRKIGNISQGNRIVATVDDQNHIRSIRLTDMADMSDRRNDEQTGRTMDTIETRERGPMGQ